MQPVVVCLVAYMFGLLSGSFLPSGISPNFFWAAPFISSTLWFFLCKRPLSASFCLALTFFFVGFLRVSLSLTPPLDTSQIHLYCGPSPLVVEGIVLQVNPRGPDQSSVDVDARLVSSRGLATEVTGHLRLYLGSGQPQLLPGDRVRFRSRLRQPRVFGTPGEFNMPRHLAYSDIWTTAYLPDTGGIVCLTGEEGGVLRLLVHWRQQCGKLIDKTVAADMAPFVKALALGERGAISSSQRQGLVSGGVAHLFAISGLHLGLLALFGYQFLLFFYRRSLRLLRWQPPQRVLPLILLPLLFGYLLLTGDALSTRRAFFVCFCLAIFLLWRRRIAPMQLLSTLALLFLLLEPLALWQASFQLSFAGVAGILCWRRYWQLTKLRSPWLLKKGLQIFMVSLAATLATAPLVLLNFHLFSPAGLINNLFAIPLVTLLAVPAGLLGILLVVLWPPLAEFAFDLCGQVLQTTVLLVNWVSDLPGLGGQILYLTRWQLMIVTIVVLVLLMPWRKVVYPALILPTLVLLLYSPPNTGAEGLSLTTFSVGQGESMLITLNEEKHILVDGGGLYSDSFDVGERLLAPALGLLGVKRLDAILLTHDHPDHSKGLHYLLKHMPVNSFWFGSDPKCLPQTLRQTLLDNKIPIRQFSAGWTAVSFSDEERLHVYVPELDLGYKNDQSVVVYVNEGKDGLLLTGDLEQSGTTSLLESGVPGPVSLLKLPHHGSRDSGSRLLLEEFHPQKVLVSVGYQNYYGFPADEVVDVIQQVGAELYRTDLNGTIRFFSEGEGWRFEQWRNGLFR